MFFKQMAEDNIYKILKKKLHQHFNPGDDRDKRVQRIQQQYDTLSQEYKTIFKDVIRLLPVLRKDEKLATEYLRFLLWMGHYDQHMSPILLPAFLFMNTPAITGSGSTVREEDSKHFEKYEFIRTNYNILKSVVQALVPLIINIGRSNSCKIPSNLPYFDFENKEVVETLLWQNLGHLFNYWRSQPSPLFPLFVETFATFSIPNKTSMYEQIRELLENTQKWLSKDTKIQAHTFFPLICILSKTTHHKKIDIEDSWSGSLPFFVLLFLLL